MQHLQSGRKSGLRDLLGCESSKPRCCSYLCPLCFPGFSWPSCVTVNCPPTLPFCLTFFLFFHTFFPQFLTCNFFLFIISLHGQNLFSQLEFLDEIDAPSNEERAEWAGHCQGHHPGRDVLGIKDSEKGAPKSYLVRKRSSRIRALRAQI